MLSWEPQSRQGSWVRPCLAPGLQTSQGSLHFSGTQCWPLLPGLRLQRLSPRLVLPQLWGHAAQEMLEKGTGPPEPAEDSVPAPYNYSQEGAFPGPTLT